MQALLISARRSIGKQDKTKGRNIRHLFCKAGLHVCATHLPPSRASIRVCGAATVIGREIKDADSVVPFRHCNVVSSSSPASYVGHLHWITGACSTSDQVRRGGGTRIEVRLVGLTRVPPRPVECRVDSASRPCHGRTCLPRIGEGERWVIHGHVLVQQ
jgi:hypothetical protein